MTHLDLHLGPSIEAAQPTLALSCRSCQFDAPPDGRGWCLRRENVAAQGRGVQARYVRPIIPTATDAAKNTAQLAFYNLDAPQSNRSFVAGRELLCMSDGHQQRARRPGSNHDRPRHAACPGRRDGESGAVLTMKLQVSHAHRSFISRPQSVHHSLSALPRTSFVRQTTTSEAKPCSPRSSSCAPPG